MDHLMSCGDRREDLRLDDVERPDFLKTLAEAEQNIVEELATLEWTEEELTTRARRRFGLSRAGVCFRAATFDHEPEPFAIGTKRRRRTLNARGCAERILGKYLRAPASVCLRVVICDADREASIRVISSYETLYQ